MFFTEIVRQMLTRGNKGPSCTKLWLVELQPAYTLGSNLSLSLPTSLPQFHSIVVNVFVSFRLWELHATSPQSSVKGSLTTRKVIFGLWAASCMNSPASRELLKLR